MNTQEPMINGAEAILGFLVWLTSRETPIILSRAHEATSVIELFDAFQGENPGIGTVRDSVWPRCINYPRITTDEHEAPQTQENTA